MPTAYLNIGSNIGDRLGNIDRAVTAIIRRFGPGVRVSPTVESEPWGYSSPNPFVNIGVALETDLSPEALLDTLAGIERSISPASHRSPDGSYADRLIDIDIVAIDEMTYSSPRLTVPHPRMHRRSFVLEPMIYLNPLWKHPVLKKSAAEMLKSL